MKKDLLSDIKKNVIHLRNENARLREALDRIARPVWWMQEDQKRATGSINGINGAMALHLANDGEFLRGIAAKALSPANAIGEARAESATSTHDQTL